MNRLFNTNYNHRMLDIALLIFRFGIVALLLTHGIPKFNTLLAGGEIHFPDPLGLGTVSSLALAVFAEVFCAILVLLGLATRLAVLPLIIMLSVIVLVIHAEDGLKEKELALHYLLAFVVLLFAGSGRFSMDNVISRKTRRMRRGY